MRLVQSAVLKEIAAILANHGAVFHDWVEFNIGQKGLLMMWGHFKNGLFKLHCFCQFICIIILFVRFY